MTEVTEALEASVSRDETDTFFTTFCTKEQHKYTDIIHIKLYIELFSAKKLMQIVRAIMYFIDLLQLTRVEVWFLCAVSSHDESSVRL